MTVIFIILGIISFLGMMILKKIKPAFYACFLVLLVCAFMLIKGSMGGQSSRVKGVINTEKAYRTARALTLADMLNADLSGKKVVALVYPNYKDDLFWRVEIEALQKSFKGELELIWVDLPNGGDSDISYSDYVTGKMLDAKLKEHSGADGYIIYAGFPEDFQRVTFVNSNKAPLYVVEIGSATPAWVKKNLGKTGKIAAVIGVNPNRDSKASPSGEYKEDFALRYKTFTKANAEEYK